MEPLQEHRRGLQFAESVIVHGSFTYADANPTLSRALDYRG